jgi:hypothetical protein
MPSPASSIAQEPERAIISRPGPDRSARPDGLYPGVADWHAASGRAARGSSAEPACRRGHHQQCGARRRLSLVMGMVLAFRRDTRYATSPPAATAVSCLLSYCARHHDTVTTPAGGSGVIELQKTEQADAPPVAAALLRGSASGRWMATAQHARLAGHAMRLGRGVGPWPERSAVGVLRKPLRALRHVLICKRLWALMHMCGSSHYGRCSPLRMCPFARKDCRSPPLLGRAPAPLGVAQMG